MAFAPMLTFAEFHKKAVEYKALAARIPKMSNTTLRKHVVNEHEKTRKDWHKLPDVYRESLIRWRMEALRATAKNINKLPPVFIANCHNRWSKWQTVCFVSNVPDSGAGPIGYVPYCDPGQISQAERESLPVFDQDEIYTLTQN